MSEDWHSLHRDRMSVLRARRRRSKKCRQCPLPAKINEKTGKPMSMCDSHLADDRARVARRYNKRKKQRR